MGVGLGNEAGSVQNTDRYKYLYTVPIHNTVFVLCRYQQMSLGHKNYESHLVER